MQRSHCGKWAAKSKGRAWPSLLYQVYSACLFISICPNRNPKPCLASLVLCEVTISVRQGIRHAGIFILKYDEESLKTGITPTPLKTRVDFVKPVLIVPNYTLLLQTYHQTPPTHPTTLGSLPLYKTVEPKVIFRSFESSCAVQACMKSLWLLEGINMFSTWRWPQ